MDHWNGGRSVDYRRSMINIFLRLVMCQWAVSFNYQDSIDRKRIVSSINRFTLLYLIPSFAHEQCIVLTSPVPRRFRTVPHHACVALAT